jgi:hypothetical protein
MKIKISKKRFNEILNEEVQKFKKIQELKDNKKFLEETLLKLENATSQEEIDELWGGVKKLFQKGTQAAGNAVKSAYQGAKADVNQLASDINQRAKVVGQNIKQQAQNIKQVYQQGEKEQAIKNTKAQIEKLWAKRKEIEGQIAMMQGEYAKLTGQKLGTQFKPRKIQTNKAAE